MDIRAHIRLWTAAHVQLFDVRLLHMRVGEKRHTWRFPGSVFGFVVEGNGTVNLDGKVWRLQPHLLFHGGKGTIMELKADGIMRCYLLIYKAELMPGPGHGLRELLEQERPFSLLYAMQTDDSLLLLDKYEHMHRLWLSGHDLDKLLARALLMQGVHEVLRQLETRGLPVQPIDPVTQTVHYIEQHYREAITLEQLAERLSCSPRQLLRRFRAERNVSPIDYLIGIRLRKAKALLTETDVQLKGIAESVGYADSYYFSRLFKKHVGVSPVHYREQIRTVQMKGRPDNPCVTTTSSIVDRGPNLYIDKEVDNHYQYINEGEQVMHNYTSRLSLATLIICLSMLLAACGNNGNAAQNQNGGNTQGAANVTDHNAANQAGESAEAATTRLIKHAMGETEVPDHPERVVILTNEGTEALLALGVKPIAAVQSWYHEPWYEHIEEQMQDVTVLGDEFQPNLELIASLKPDLILGNKARQEELYEALNKIAPTVFAEDLLGDWKINFALYAEALNLQDESKKLMDVFDKRVAEASAKLADHLDTKVSVVRFLPTSVRIYQKMTFSGVLLSQLGFARPPAQDVDNFIEVMSKETIPDMDGDVMFYFQTDIPGGEDTSKVVEEWMNDPLFQNLQVYKNDKIVKVSEAIWNSGGGYLAANVLLDEIVAYFEAQ